MSVMQLLVVQLAGFLAALLLVTGLHKLIQRERAQAVVQDFAGVTPRLAPLAVLLVGATELLAGALLWSAAYRAAGAALAGLLWSGYLLLILRAIAQGRRDLDCGCTFGASRRPLGLYPVARNTVLAGMALLVALSSLRAVAVAAGAAEIVAACALLSLYGALDQVMALAAPRRGELL
jgi:hypothetical protein